MFQIRIDIPIPLYYFARAKTASIRICGDCSDMCVCHIFYVFYWLLLSTGLCSCIISCLVLYQPQIVVCRILVASQAHHAVDIRQFLPCCSIDLEFVVSIHTLTHTSIPAAGPYPIPNVMPCKHHVSKKIE